MRRLCLLLGCLSSLAFMGCAAAVVGGGATAYKVGTDERSVPRMWNDTAITTRINSELVRDPVTKARNIDVDVVDGEVVLSGFVETEIEAQRAAEIADSVAGVRKVTSHLEVGSKTVGQIIDDQVVGNTIKGKLVTEPSVRSLNVDVDVDKGVVTLTGIVKSQAQKDRVVEIANSTSGAVQVIDHLQLKSHEEETD